MGNIKKSKFFDALAVRVASGMSIRDAAKEVGCAAPTAYQLSAQTDFQIRVNELRTEATNEAVGSLTNLARTAIQTLGDVMTMEEARPQDRIAAAVAVLKIISPFAELHEIRRRVDELEKMAAEKKTAETVQK
jgi:hypothetical protein